MWWNIKFAKWSVFRSTLLVDRAGQKVLKKLREVFPSRRWAGSSPDHSFDLVILITITKMTIIKQWREYLLGVANFTKSPKYLHFRDSECCLPAVIIPSNLSYSHKYGAYSYLLLFITQNIWYKFLSSFIFSPNVVKKREGVLLDENWLLLLNGGEMV